MRPAERFRRALGRTDLRAALAIAALLTLALAIQATVLYAFLAKESLEEADRWGQHALEIVDHEAGEGEPIEAFLKSLDAAFPRTPPALRVLDQHGLVVGKWRSWPAEESQKVPLATSDRKNLAALRLLRPDRYLIGGVRIASGDRVEVALPLAHFANELVEVRNGLVAIVLLSGVASLAIGALATARAFAPLAWATRLISAADVHALRARLPTRGTGDPVDRHAETVNRVLARLEAAFDRLTQFSSDAAHELRTPLNRIGNLAEVALLNDDEREPRRALEAILATSEDLSRTVQQLLLLAEIDDGRLALRASVFDVDAWIADTLAAYAPVFEERGVKLAGTSDAGKLRGDRPLLDRVLVNLLENALRYGADGGRVELSARRSGDAWVLWVDDAGPGVPPGERERIFGRFSRLQPHRGGGSGLGLALSRSIARLHGGDLGVEDAPLGGARFALRLPAQA
jgi:two-component system heavy metal sensor histidine kinase CusS